MVTRYDKNIISSIQKRIAENSCVAFTRNDCGTVVWSYNKRFEDQNEKTMRKTIEKLLSSRKHETEFYDAKYAFTTFDPHAFNYERNLLPIEEHVYDLLLKHDGGRIPFGYISKKIYLPVNKYLAGINGRAFSCAEKRLVGHIAPASHFYNGEIIVSKRPCYYCIPVASTFVFIDNREFWILNVKNVNSFCSILKLIPINSR